MLNFCANALLQPNFSNQIAGLFPGVENIPQGRLPSTRWTVQKNELVPIQVIDVQLWVSRDRHFRTLSDPCFLCVVVLDLLILVRYRRSRAGISESNTSLSEVNSDS